MSEEKSTNLLFYAGAIVFLSWGMWLQSITDFVDNGFIGILLLIASILAVFGIYYYRKGEKENE